MLGQGKLCKDQADIRRISEKPVVSPGAYAYIMYMEIMADHRYRQGMARGDICIWQGRNKGNIFLCWRLSYGVWAL